MSSDVIRYSTQAILGEGTNADIDTTEEDVVTITDLQKLNNSQVSLYINTTFGTHTSMQYRVYYRHQVDGDWFPRVKQNASDNTIDDFPVIVDASTPNSGDIVYSFDMDSCYAMKVTGQGVGGANGAATIKVLGRDN